MKQKTNQEIEYQFIESLINRVKAKGSVGKKILRDIIKPVLEEHQKERADVAPLLQSINDFLETVHIREQQAPETDDKAERETPAPATED